MKDPTLENEYYVRLSGKANIPEPLEIGRNYKLITSGTITSFTESDLNDGRHVIYYKYAPILVELVDDLGESIRAKDTRSLSSLFRARMWKWWSNSPQGLEFDQFYETLMQRMIQQADEVAELYGLSTVKVD